MRHSFFRKFSYPLLTAWLIAACCPNVLAEGGGYRVEVLVFRHVNHEEPALEVDTVRGFHDLLDLTESTLPEAPVLQDARGGTFDDMRRRLARMDAYEPLAILIYEQSRIDYHPPVRLHNEVVIAEDLHFPGEVIYIDLQSADMLAPYVLPLYQFDGSIQLRRSRFLHIELDLEFRVEDPAWDAAFPPLDNDQGSGEERGADLFSVNASQGNPSQGNETPDPEPALDEVLIGQAPEPFRIYRLQQSRQVRTGNIHYFDSPFLGAMVRVTPTQDTP